MTVDARKLAAWKTLLDACDDLAAGTLALGERGTASSPVERTDAAPPIPEAREAAPATRASIELRQRGLDAARDGALDESFRGASTGRTAVKDPQDRLLLALLVQQQLSGKQSSMRVRDLLALVADSSFERLNWLARLQPNGALAHSEFVAIDLEEDDSDDPLEASVRLSRQGFERFVLQQSEAPESAADKIENEGQLLARLHELGALYERRASRIFENDEKGPMPPSKAEDREIDRMEALEVLLADLFAEQEPLPFRSNFLDAVRKFRLSFDEAFVVGFLLLEELIDGDPWQQGAHVLRLLADSEGDLWDLRRVLEPDAPLRRHGLIVLEEMIDGRPLTADIALSTWLAQRLTADAEQVIPSDERIDFHLYLKDLGDSESFFRRLDTNRGAEEG